MTFDDHRRTAQNFSRGLSIVGAIVLMVCVGILTVTWWQDGRWGWVALGIAVIVVNIVLVVLQFRRKPEVRPAASDADQP